MGAALNSLATMAEDTPPPPTTPTPTDTGRPTNDALLLASNNEDEEEDNNDSKQEEEEDLSKSAEGEESLVDDDEPDEDNNNKDEQGDVHTFNGVAYSSWKDMVDAKRQFRRQQLDDLIQEPLYAIRTTTTHPNPNARKRPPRANKKDKAALPPPRRSKRVRQEAAEDIYIDREHAGGVVTLQGSDAAKITPEKAPPPPVYYGGRVNDGSALSLEESTVDLVPERWQTNGAHDLLQRLVDVQENPSKASLLDAEDSVAAISVAKVVPDRIYGMAVHPHRDHLLVCAGDKQGHVGLWQVGDNNHDDNGEPEAKVHRFKYHAGAAASLQWTRDGQSLFSTSYDGTCRFLDVATGTARCVFAAYNDDMAYVHKAGYGLDQWHSYWTQFGCLDARQEDCFFVSTSTGCLYHVDSRVRGRASLTFQHQLSDKKINSVSLHPNGHSLVTAGLDGRVCLWDVRQFVAATRTAKSTTKTSTARVPIASYHGTKSINSAFFAPSGKSVVATTMHNRLDVLVDFQTETGPVHKAVRSIRHDNHTGRWLTTFHAVWHPTLDVFGVGSMARPRVVDVFTTADTNTSPVSNEVHHETRGGDLLTAVASRVAFHPRTDRLVLAGGNSSGRVTIVR
jgi:WD40 repeat protein